MWGAFIIPPTWSCIDSLRTDSEFGSQTDIQMSRQLSFNSPDSHSPTPTQTEAAEGTHFCAGRGGNGRLNCGCTLVPLAIGNICASAGLALWRVYLYALLDMSQVRRLMCWVWLMAIRSPLCAENSTTSESQSNCDTVHNVDKSPNLVSCKWTVLTYKWLGSKCASQSDEPCTWLLE